MITIRTSSSRTIPAFAAVSAAVRAVGNALVTRWVIMANRRRLKGLEELDDYLLADIGLTREDIRSALKLPGDVDPSFRLAALLQDRAAPPRPASRTRGR